VQYEALLPKVSNRTSYQRVICAAGDETLVRPSSRSTNAILSFDQKLRFWRDILK
jgi:hypothetical protein